jgi:hypothetical protein
MSNFEICLLLKKTKKTNFKIKLPSFFCLLKRRLTNIKSKSFEGRREPTKKVFSELKTFESFAFDTTVFFQCLSQSERHWVLPSAKLESCLSLCERHKKIRPSLPFIKSLI